jgi:hypothetical protein
VGRWRSARGQATAEHLGAIVAVAAVLAGVGGVLVRAGVPQAAPNGVAVALGGEREQPAAPAPRLQPATYASALAAVRGEPGAYSLAGARALLEEDLGPLAGSAALDVLLLQEARRRHAAWFEPSSARFPRPNSPLVAHVAASGEDDVAVHVVTPGEESAAGAPGPRGGWSAALLSLAESAAGAAAHRVHAVAGLAVDGALLLGSRGDGAGDGVPAGERAGDVVLCQRFTLRVREGEGPEQVAFDGVRVGVIRDGELVRDALADAPRCG